MHTPNPKRRDAAQADPARCFRCKSPTPTAHVQVFEHGHVITREVPKSWPFEVTGAGNRPITVWLCFACLQKARAEKAESEAGPHA